MNRQWILTLALIVCAFVLGMQLGEPGDAPVAVISSGGPSLTAPAEVPADGLRLSGASKAVAGAPNSAATLLVKEGELIQDAVRAAEPGAVIRVMPGDYHETVYIDKDGIRLYGVIEQGRRATLDGRDILNDAILFSGNNVVVEGFHIVNYKGNGIMSQAGNNYEIRNNLIKDTGVYGIFPQLGTNGVVEHNIVSGIEDAAIYVGMSDNVHVAYNEVFDSVAGIEVENSRHVIVESNMAHNNSGGILAFITPGLPIKTTYDVIIRNNWVSANNTPNFGAPGSIVSGIPAGTGIMLMAADEVVVEGNIISGNQAIGILSLDHNTAAEFTNITIDPEVDPNSDGLKILDNVMVNNGYDTIEVIRALALAEFQTGNPDILALGPSRDSCIVNRHRYVTVGLKDFGECEASNTAGIGNYLLPPVAPRIIAPGERGEIAYLGICTGCHSYTGRLIGPPVQLIQAMYGDDAQALADYIAAPVKKWDGYPEMPPQDYLDEETRMAVADYMLSRAR